MALRLVLVSLVASLGFDFPDGVEMASWTRGGREWVGARISDFCSIRSETATACINLADCDRGGDLSAAAGSGECAVDLAFDVVVEGMASNFATDLAASRGDDPAPDPSPDRIADGPRGVVPTELAWVDPEPAPLESMAEVSGEAPVSSVDSPRDSRRVERLYSAIRLTRRAIDAWVSLIEGSTDAIADAR